MSERKDRQLSDPAASLAYPTRDECNVGVDCTTSYTSLDQCVSVPRHELIQLQRIIHCQQAKLQACSDLSLMVFERDKELEKVRDTNKQLDVTLQRTEGRLASLTRGQSVPSSQKFKLISRGSTGTSVESADSSTESRSAESLFGSPPTSLGSTPGVSRVVFENVVKDNIKLKHHLSELLEGEGRQLKSFLEATEYKRIVETLRRDLQQKEVQLQSSIRITRNCHDGDIGALGREVTDLRLQVAKLDKALSASQSLRDSLSLECQKLLSKNSLFETRASELQRKVNDSQECACVKTSGDRLAHLPPELGVNESGLESDNVQALIERLMLVESLLEESRSSEERMKADLGRLSNENGVLERELQQARKYKKEDGRMFKGLSDEIKDEQNRDSGGLRIQIGELEADKVKDRDTIGRLHDEKDIYQTQMQQYLLDFEAEKEEKRRQKNMFEVHISQQHIHIRRLSSEAERLAKLLSDERQRSRQSQYPRQGVTQSTDGSAMSCGLQAAESYRSISNYGHSEPVCVTSDSHPGGGATDGIDYECPRCMRTFRDQSEWQKHCDKCLDS